MLKPTYHLPPLPPPGKLESEAVLRATMSAVQQLAEVKGRAPVIPNQGILIDTLALQEALASSEIENIITTQDEMFKADIFSDGPISPASKEVALYGKALRHGWERMRQSGQLLTNNIIIEMFQSLKRTQGGFRETSGTALRNEASGEIVYVPPQSKDEIIAYMTTLERFINDETVSSLHPLVKMALIHHQFESIHPFPDGNGRIGRIVNVLYLTRTGLLEIPILYLSRYITAHKADYYRLLQAVRDEGVWEEWILYMLRAVEETSRQTLELIEGIRYLMADYKHRIRKELPRIYTQDLLNNLFRHPYTRIEFLQKETGKSRQTAANYLETLAQSGFVEKHTHGKHNYYINKPLISLFLRTSTKSR